MENFYHPVKIGSLQIDGNIFLAPVAGYTDFAFREICTQNGADLCFTEMISSEAIIRKNPKTLKLAKRAPSQKIFAVQIFGANPLVMATAARTIYEKTACNLIDINCGCPVNKIVKSGAGSALLRDPQKFFCVADSVVKAVSDFGVPISVKIRSGWDSNTILWKEIVDAAIEAGICAITLHARTRAQFYEGRVDKKILCEFVESVKKKSAQEQKSVCAFASGDIFSPKDAKSILQESKCDGVMFARGALGNPFIFSETKNFLKYGDFCSVPFLEKIKAAFFELELLTQEIGENSACTQMRKRFCAYAKSAPNAAELRRRFTSCKSKVDYEKAVFGKS